jgi:hypothetical protein
VSDFRTYWRAYGGLTALVRSPYLWSAIAVTALVWRGHEPKDGWASLALTVLPSLLGLTIGAMAIVLAFPTTAMFRHLAEDGREDSYYIQLAAKLVHFILVQVSGILVSIISQSSESEILKPISLFLLTYAVLTSAAIALALFNMATLYNEDAGRSR